MYLYKISQDVNDNYDTYDSAIVVAKSEDEARLIHPRGTEREPWDGIIGTWAGDPSQVQVELIGIAEPTLEPGTVVLASFNAG